MTNQLKIDFSAEEKKKQLEIAFPSSLETGKVIYKKEKPTENKNLG